MAIGEIGDNVLFSSSLRGRKASTNVVTVIDSKTLADRIEDLLPQTQCTKCGYPACRPYAEAVARGEANYNQCPPGGAEGIARLAALLGKPVIPLNSANGVERPRPLAVIDEQVCIGCTLCMQACPVDAIVGAPKQMHTVIAELCTGCDLCVPPCPVDCIAMPSVTGDATGWDAWSQSQADAARERHNRREARLAREREAAEARAAARRAVSSTPAQASGNRCLGNTRRARSGRRRSEKTRDHPGRARACAPEERRVGRQRPRSAEHRARQRRRAGADRRRRSTPPPSRTRRGQHRG